ncbi:MAG TPA: DNA helicase PcrA [Armatimonadota bacterium]|jgi:DNA helicase-2/ATP-dependent DNA helicase PcrA
MLNTSPEQILENLNPHQLEAVTYGDGPLLIFAGAGSGKTRVLTHRIAYLLLERGVSGEQVMAVTFTNKAANEMKERIGRLVGAAARRMWVGTFHALCVRALRQDGMEIGIPQNFVIFDTDDQLTVIKDCYAEFNIDVQRLKPNTVLNRISNAKNELLTPNDYAATAYTPEEKMTGRIYARYQQRLEENSGMDFDDLIMKTVELFKSKPAVLHSYQERFRYLFVDEYQDINKAQYEFVSLLAKGSRNLCVVGDDDQSIYTWRGADMRLILQYEKDYPDAHVIKMEQNYRSPQNILDAAYHVISKNKGRKEKRLWTERDAGARIKCYRANDEHSEAAFIARSIRDMVRHEGRRYQDFAVLYRINALSRVLEQMMLSQGLPYRIVGGQKFFSRKEIKDVLAYLRVLYNPDDSVSLRRIINTPTRGIGATTITHLEDLAATRGISLFQMVLSVEHTDLSPRAQTAVRSFALIMRGLMELSVDHSITELTQAVIDDSGYERALLDENTVQSRTRAENIRELLSATQEFEAEAENDEGRNLRAFLEQVSLVADIESNKTDENAVTLMTLHAAKGLEFPVVFLTGMEEGVFPLARAAMSADPTDLEEERRLCYVGITRAEEQLCCTLASSRTLFGATTYNKGSRFLNDIPDHLIEGVEGWTTEHTERQAISTWEEADVTQSRDAEIILAASKPRETDGFRSGDRVRHNTFGEGLVLAIQGSGDTAKVTVNFPRIGTKTLVLAYAPLTRL